MTSRLLRCPHLCSQSVPDARIGGLQSDLLATYPAVNNTYKISIKCNFHIRFLSLIFLLIVRSFQVVSSMLSKWLRESLRQLLLWTSLATSLTAVLTIATGVLLALDSFSLTDSAAPIKQLGSEVLDLEITRSFEDFYSVFNEKGGWQNFSIVLIAVRQLQISLC